MSERHNTEEEITLGAYLQRLRTEKNISVAEMATKMYLQPNVILALEQDDHENLPGSLYVRGYLQLYAKILNVPADQILAMHKQGTAEPPKQAAETLAPLKPETKQPGHWTHIIIYLAVFFLTLAAVALWRSQYAQESVETSAGLDRPAIITEDTDTTHYLPEDTNTEEIGGDTDAAETPNRETAKEPVTESEPETAPAATENASEPERVYESTTIISGVGPDTITVVLVMDCWIEIFDADNEKVYYDLAQAGQTLILNGVAPFSVLLGNANAGTVEINNIPFDITPHVTGIGIARFVLGEDQG